MCWTAVLFSSFSWISHFYFLPLPPLSAVGLAGYFAAPATFCFCTPTDLPCLKWLLVLCPLVGCPIACLIPLYDLILFNLFTSDSFANFKSPPIKCWSFPVSRSFLLLIIHFGICISLTEASTLFLLSFLSLKLSIDFSSLSSIFLAYVFFLFLVIILIDGLLYLLVLFY